MTRYAVLGASGQLGRDLCPRLPGEVIALGRDRADLTQPNLLSATLSALRPDVIVNCAAFNFVDRAETEEDTAFDVNSWGVHDLAIVARELDALLVHFSTDYVFGLDESRRTPWHEIDPPGPVNVYGMSKLIGENLIRETTPRHLIVRTCGLYGVWGSGGKGGNFVETIRRRAAQGQPLRVVDDQECTPSYTVDVAAATVRLLGMGRTGLVHVTNADSCSWYEFARAIFELTGTWADVTPITSREYGAPARRPTYSVLATSGETLRPWRAALAAYLEERTGAKT